MDINKLLNSSSAAANGRNIVTPPFTIQRPDFNMPLPSPAINTRQSWTFSSLPSPAVSLFGSTSPSTSPSSTPSKTPRHDACSGPNCIANIDKLFSERVCEMKVERHDQKEKRMSKRAHSQDNPESTKQAKHSAKARSDRLDLSVHMMKFEHFTSKYEGPGYLGRRGRCQNGFNGRSSGLKQIKADVLQDMASAQAQRFMMFRVLGYSCEEIAKYGTRLYDIQLEHLEEKDGYFDCRAIFNVLPPPAEGPLSQDPRFRGKP